MAEDTDDEQQETPVAKKRISLLVLVLVGFVAAGAGFATPYVVPGVVDAQGEDEEPAGEEPPIEFPKPNGEIAYIQFGESVVNLNDGRMSRYLRVNMTLQVDEAQEEQITQLVEKKRLILKDWLLRYLSDKDMDAVRGKIAVNRIRREVTDHFNTTLFPDGYDRIQSILFEEFNVQ